MSPDDGALVLDMWLAARRAQAYVRDVSRTDFERNLMLQDAVAHQIQIIGEAAGQVSAEFQLAHSEIPWRQIIGMRHRLVHGYREVRPDVVWDTARNAIESLIAALQPLIPPEEAD